MKAARIHRYGQPLVLEDVPTPRPGPGQVLVRIEGAGFCHSDIHVIDGEIQVLPRMPLILGHENAGTVAAIGAGVEAVHEGDPVAVFGGWGCGRCDYCVTGHEQLCETPQWAGLSAHDGGYAEYLLVPHERYLVKLSRLSPAEAAPLTDAALTPYRAIRKALPFLDPDHYALVIGLGGLGQYGLKLLHLLAGCPVIAVDVSPNKLQIAREREARFCIVGGQAVNAYVDPVVGLDLDLVMTVSDLKQLEPILRERFTVDRFPHSVKLSLAGSDLRVQIQTDPRYAAFERMRNHATS